MARSLRVSSVCPPSSRFSPACTAASGPRSWSSRRACWTYQSLRWSCIATSSDEGSLARSTRTGRSLAWLILKIRPRVFWCSSGLVLWHWFLSYQSITCTEPSGPYWKFSIWLQASLASRKSGP